MIELSRGFNQTYLVAKLTYICSFINKTENACNNSKEQLITRLCYDLLHLTIDRQRNMLASLLKTDFEGKFWNFSKNVNIFICLCENRRDDRRDFQISNDLAFF